LAPQVGLEPTTLRLTAPEIWFSGIQRRIAARCDRRRYVALIPAFSWLLVHLPRWQRKSNIATDYDPFLEGVGKEMGKEKRLAEILET
jgi:hypothetical protein